MVKIGNVEWPGPVGIGAGIIKGSAAFLDYANLADSLEIGSITSKLWHGNEGQTIWREQDTKSLRHNAGMPNPGAEEIVRQLFEAQVLVKIPWGLNVAVTPGITNPDEAAIDLTTSIRTLLVGGLRPSWITYNTSSPDTADDLSMLMSIERVSKCLTALQLAASDYDLPVWLKLGPVADQNVLSEILVMAGNQGVGAIVVSNAMRDKNGLVGGWCGQALKPVRNAMVQAIRDISQTVPIVAVGGVLTGADVKEALHAGANAVQVVSALLFNGHEAARLIRQEWEGMMVV